MEVLRARQPYGDPTHPGNPSTTAARAARAARKIKIRHPGYDEPTNILLQIDAYDEDCGIHYETIHAVCAIVTDNKWEGYFSADAEGIHRVHPSAPDVLLEDDSYYFQVPGEYNYAVVPTFTDWSFPHDDLPENWRRPSDTSEPPGLLRVDQDHCSMTRSTLRVETAHIVPANPFDVKWWNDNGMSRYGEPDSIQNTIRFKVDVHEVFDDEPCFAIVPKNNALVAHIFHATEKEVEAVRLYHNVPLQFLEVAQREFLLTRLAWMAFRYLEIFFSSGKRRIISRIGDDGVRIVEEVDGDKCHQIYAQSRASNISRIGDDGVRIVEEVDGDKCHQIYAQSRVRSTSHCKRNIGQVNSTVPRNGDGNYDNESATDSDDEERRRGRKRRRSF